MATQQTEKPEDAVPVMAYTFKDSINHQYPGYVAKEDANLKKKVVIWWKDGGKGKAFVALVRDKDFTDSEDEEDNAEEDNIVAIPPLVHVVPAVVAEEAADQKQKIKENAKKHNAAYYSKIQGKMAIHAGKVRRQMNNCEPPMDVNNYETFKSAFFSYEGKKFWEDENGIDKTEVEAAFEKKYLKT